MSAVSIPNPINTPQNKRKFVWWRLLRTKGARDASHIDLENFASGIENVETACGALVFLGIVVEVLIAIVNPAYGAPLERWGVPIADGFVALGVIGEVLASSRGRVVQGELTRRSNSELAQAQKVAGKAIERAAAAERDAAVARERTAEIEKVTAWRRLSPEQKALISEALRGTEIPAVAIIEYQTGDPEAHALARDVLSAISASGVKAARFKATWHLDLTVFDTFVALSSDLQSYGVIKAFESAGVRLLLGHGFKPSDRGNVGEWEPNIYCWVGPRAAPSLAPAGSSIQTATPSPT